jgi:hypothetical protein
MQLLDRFAEHQELDPQHLELAYVFVLWFGCSVLTVLFEEAS